MSPLKKPEDDSYRIYMAGLALEGLGYEEAKRDPKNAKGLLTKAFGQFEEARRLKPKESYY